MRAQEAFQSSNITATTSAFLLSGGQYRFSVVATFNAGSVGFEQLGPDGSTWLAVIAALTANGGSTFQLAPGQYRFSVSLATGVFVQVVRIPGD